MSYSRGKKTNGKCPYVSHAMSGIIKESHACSEEGLGERNHQETRKKIKERSPTREITH